MNIACIYENRHILPPDVYEHWDADHKTHLNGVEHIGLEAILVAFIQQYEEEDMGSIFSSSIRDYTYWHKDGISILDGCYDTYVFSEFAIDSIWMTSDGAVVLDCYHLDNPNYEDPWEIIEHTDWQSECERVLFRLD